MNDLRRAIKTLIIDSLSLEDMTPDDIQDDAPLFTTDNGGLGLDSVDALELGLALQKKFGFRMESDGSALREHFRSVNTLAAFVSSMQRGEGA